MLKYRDKVEMPPELTLRDAEEIGEYLAQVGEAQISPRDRRTIYFSLEADDLWDACEKAYLLAGELASRGVNWNPEKSYVEEVADER